MTTQSPRLTPRRAAPAPQNIVMPLPEGMVLPAKEKAEVVRTPAPRPGRRQVTDQQLRNETRMYNLQFLLQMTWIVVRLVAALVPFALLAAWGVEVYRALTVGGQHVAFALAGLAILVVFGMVATAVERFKNHRAGQHVYLHHRDR